MTSEVQKRQLVFKNWPIIDNLNWTSFRIKVGFIGGHEIVRFLIRFIPNHSFRLFEQTILGKYSHGSLSAMIIIWKINPKWYTSWKFYFRGHAIFLCRLDIFSTRLNFGFVFQNGTMVKTRVWFHSIDRKWPWNFTQRLENQPRITKPQRVPISSFILYGSLFRIWKKLKSDCGCETTVELVGLFYLRQC